MGCWCGFEVSCGGGGDACGCGVVILGGLWILSVEGGKAVEDLEEGVEQDARD